MFLKSAQIFSGVALYFSFVAAARQISNNDTTFRKWLLVDCALFPWLFQ